MFSAMAKLRLHAAVENAPTLRLEKSSAAAPGRCVLDDQIGYLLRVAMQRYTAIFTARMIEGLTRTQFTALAKLAEAGPCSQNQLGRLIYLDAATIKGVVDRLGARGLVTARNDPADRRRRAVTLVERGREVTVAARLIAAEVTAATLSALNDDDRGTVIELLRKLS
jgi:MarR family transcriptional regulator, lower aerobic nicotinate degradation pathway regulator